MKLHHVIWCREPVNVPAVMLKEYNTETAFHIYCADWLRKCAERYGVRDRNRGYSNWHHSANERFGVLAGFRAKMMGQRKGFLDFIQLELRIGIELKLPGYKASPAQRREIEYLKSIGWAAEVVTSFEMFRATVEGRIIELKAF